MNPKYVLEAGTSQPVTSTPVPNPNPSISTSESSATVQPGELEESTDESDLIEESASLFSTISRSKNLSKKGKGPAQPKGKRSKPVEDQDDKTDDPGGGGGRGVLGPIFAGYVPLASQNPYPIIVYSVASYRPHLSHFWANVIFAIPS